MSCSHYNFPGSIPGDSILVALIHNKCPFLFAINFDIALFTTILYLTFVITFENEKSVCALFHINKRYNCV